MKVAIFLERGNPPRLNHVYADTFALLERRGIECSLIYPEEQLIALDTLKVEADLYLLKSDSELSLSLATALEAMGGRILNSARASQLAKNKVLASSILSSAGLPAPRSVAGATPMQVAASFQHESIIFKPYRGYHGVGIAVAHQGDPLPAPTAYPDIVFAQEYLGVARKDLKVFVIGEHVFGVRKEFSADSYLQVGVPTALSPEIDDIVRRCGRAFGLELYGLDIAEDERGASIIDVNYLPGYRGIPDASRLLAEHITSALRN